MQSKLDTIVGQGDELFSRRAMLHDLWQTEAENFYPERADFTTVRNVGEELAGDLMSSYPLLARRSLGNAFSAMLRPTAKDWFKMRTARPDQEDTAAKQWLEWAAKLMKNVMYDRRSGFSRATKEADHDFATFGQAVLSVEPNKQRNGLLFRNWHLRDVVWVEDETGQTCTTHRKWKPTASELFALFGKGGNLHHEVIKALEKTPYREFNCRHVIMRADEYARLPGAKQWHTPYVSIYLDVDNMHEIEAVGSWTKHYVIPRWQTVSGSQYAHSPATVAALPDARLIQTISLTLLKAGEKSVDPPMVAVKEAIRSDVNIYAGGITWVDAEYDERMGDVLRAMSVDKTGLSFGLENVQDLRTQLADAWFLSKLNLPPVTGREMTAYEVQQRIAEFVRDTLPLFEPMEHDYNGALCDVVFDLIMHFAPEVRQSAPDSLRGADIQFTFESPLSEAIEKAKVGQFAEAQQVLAMAIQLDPSAAHVMDGPKATRDVLGAVVPAAWLRDEETVDNIVAQAKAQAEAAQALAMMQGGADVAKTLKDAGLGSPVGGVA